MYLEHPDQVMEEDQRTWAVAPKIHPRQSSSCSRPGLKMIKPAHNLLIIWSLSTSCCTCSIHPDGWNEFLAFSKKISNETSLSLIIRNVDLQPGIQKSMPFSVLGRCALLPLELSLATSKSLGCIMRASNEANTCEQPSFFMHPKQHRGVESFHHQEKMRKNGKSLSGWRIAG